uniref:Uncharacterized protein n=1 Tax=Anguilla anguilla TaxID=7936 RepID=A0A0E9PLB1_ANGAN
MGHQYEFGSIIQIFKYCLIINSKVHSTLC